MPESFNIHETFKNQSLHCGYKKEVYAEVKCRNRKMHGTYTTLLSLTLAEISDKWRTETVRDLVFLSHSLHFN